MNFFRKKSSASQSSFVVLDESQELVKPESASIGTDPIFPFPDFNDAKTQCSISIPIDKDELDISLYDIDDEERCRRFWKLAIAERDRITDELNNSSRQLDFIAEEQLNEAELIEKRFARLYAAVSKDLGEGEGDDETNGNDEEDDDDQGEEEEKEESNEDDHHKQS